MNFYVENRKGSVAVLVSDVRVAQVGSIDHAHSAFADDAEPVSLLDDDRGVLVDADTKGARILCNRAYEATDSSSLREMLIDDYVIDEPKAGCELHAFAKAHGGLIGSAYHHCRAHHRCARGSPRNRASRIVNLLKPEADGCEAKLARDLELVSSGEKHSVRIVQDPD